MIDRVTGGGPNWQRVEPVDPVCGAEFNPHPPRDPFRDADLRQRHAPIKFGEKQIVPSRVFNDIIQGNELAALERINDAWSEIIRQQPLTVFERILNWAHQVVPRVPSSSALREQRIEAETLDPNSLANDPVVEFTPPGSCFTYSVRHSLIERIGQIGMQNSSLADRLLVDASWHPAFGVF